MRAYGRRTLLIATMMVMLGFAGEVAGAASSSPVASGFNPRVWGFSFENYSTDAKDRQALPMAKLTPGDAFRVFGAQACQNRNPRADDCVPNLTVEEWLADVNAVGTDGHCFGMAVTAQKLFNRDLWPNQIDPSYSPSSTTWDLVQPSALVNPKANFQALRRADSLRKEIYLWYQAQEGVDFSDWTTSPSEATETLANQFSEDPNRSDWLVVFRNHAITPVGVSRLNGHRYAIDVYDNNFPGVKLQILVDIQRNTFLYQGTGDNPDYVYRGQGRDGNLALTRLSAVRFPPCAKGICDRQQIDSSVDLTISRAVTDSGKRPLAIRVANVKGRRMRNAVWYTDRSADRAQVSVPRRVRRLFVTVTNLARTPQSISTTSFGGQASTGTDRLRIPARRSVEIELRRQRGVVNTLGAARKSTWGVANDDDVDYRVEIGTARGAITASSTSFDIGLRNGIAKMVTRGGASGPVIVRVTKRWTDESTGVAQTLVKVKRVRLRGRGHIAVNYGWWTNHDSPVISAR